MIYVYSFTLRCTAATWSIIHSFLSLLLPTSLLSPSFSDRLSRYLLTSPRILRSGRRRFCSSSCKQGSWEGIPKLDALIYISQRTVRAITLSKHREGTPTRNNVTLGVGTPRTCHRAHKYFTPLPLPTLMDNRLQRLQ